MILHLDFMNESISMSNDSLLTGTAFFLLFCTTILFLNFVSFLTPLRLPLAANPLYPLTTPFFLTILPPLPPADLFLFFRAAEADLR